MVDSLARDLLYPILPKGDWIVQGTVIRALVALTIDEIGHGIKQVVVARNNHLLRSTPEDGLHRRGSRQRIRSAEGREYQSSP
jgi:hypothetical protein